MEEVILAVPSEHMDEIRHKPDEKGERPNGPEESVDVGADKCRDEEAGGLEEPATEEIGEGDPS